MDPVVAQRLDDSLNRLTKWRAVFTGRMLGTRERGDIEAIAFRDLFEKLILLRAEGSAMTRLLIGKGVFTEDEWGSMLATEADELNKLYEEHFPGMTASEDGITYKVPEALHTMQGWKP